MLHHYSSVLINLQSHFNLRPYRLSLSFFGHLLIPIVYFPLSAISSWLFLNQALISAFYVFIFLLWYYLTFSFLLKLSITLCFGNNILFCLLAPFLLFFFRGRGGRRRLKMQNSLLLACCLVLHGIRLPTTNANNWFSEVGRDASHKYAILFLLDMWSVPLLVRRMCRNILDRSGFLLLYCFTMNRAQHGSGHELLYLMKVFN